MTLKEWRFVHGMTQTELAKEIGVAGPTIIRWESGKGKPSPRYVPKLMKLGLTQEDLYEMFVRKSK